MVKGLRKRFCLMILTTGAVAALLGCSGSAKETAKQGMTATGRIVTETAVAGAPAAANVKEDEAQAVSESAIEEAAASAKTKKSEVKDESIRVLTGKVTDAGTNTVTIVSDRYPDGVTFSKEDVVTQFGNGLLLEQEITIFYLGEIQNGSAAEVSVEFIRDKRDKDNECQAAMISGKVVTAGMSAITIETEAGKSISFEQDPKPVNLTSGPLEGDTVTILYSYNDEGGDGAVVPELIR